ncbi:MAG: GHKL domain-containing protein [Oscillospiraceae bacterium]
MMNDLSNLTSFIQLSINFLVYLFFILTSFKGKFRYRPMVQRVVVIAYVLISTAIVMLCLLRDAPLGQYRIPMMTLWIIGTIFTAFMLLRSNPIQVLFMIFLVFDIQFNIMRVSELVFKLDFIPHIFENGSVHILFVNLIVMLAFIPPMWYLFIRLFKKVINTEIDNSYWKYLFLIPTSSYLYSVLSSINYSLNDDTELLTALFIMLLMIVFSFMSYVVVLHMLVITNDRLMATKKTTLMQQQLAIQVEQYQKLTENLHQTERLRHDMRHHFVTLKGYVENKDWEDANRYLDICIGKELPKEESAVCENHAVDMILRHYIALARENDTEVKVSVCLDKDFKAPDTDLCVIFGNLIENAVESCAKQMNGRKFIEIKAKPIRGNMLAIMVTNSYDGDIVQNGDDFASTKHNGEGIGTYSIRSIVEKNGGNCRFSFGDNVFKASVLLVP